MAILRGTPGEVISEGLGVVVLAGKEVVLQPFEMAQLARSGDWNPAPLHEALRRRRFSLVVVGFDLEDPSTWRGHTDRFPQELIEVMARHYRLASREGAARLYVPRSGADPPDGASPAGSPL